MTTPRTIRPMLAETAPAPFDSDAHSFEVKWDGFRAILFWANSEIRLQSRNLHDLTPRFPEFVDVARSGNVTQAIGARDAVLDGELVIVRDGRPDFQALLARGASVPGRSAPPWTGASTRRGGHRGESDGHATYVAFDLLYLHGESLLNSPYIVRRERLAQLLGSSDRITLCTAVEGRGKALFDAARERGLEGVVAKRSESPYLPGRRSSHWLKVRHTHSLDAVIGGFAVREGHLASVVLGVYPQPSDDVRQEGDLLIPLGHVGTGLSEAGRATLLTALERIRTEHSPFAERSDPLRGSPFSSRRPSQIFWVKPILVCRVEALERTSDGKLRHPVFRGLRSDKDPEACTLTQIDGPNEGVSGVGQRGEGS